MPKYRLLMRGEDFSISVDGKRELLGFYQTIHVEAQDPEEAENEAVKIIRQSDLRETILEGNDYTPMIYLDEIEQIESFEGIESLIEGRGFFPMSGLRKRWWQFWK